MNKQEIIQKLQDLDLPKEDYWLVAGSAMVMHGIREETRDIDLGCSKKLADRLEAEACPTELLTDGSRRIVLGNEIEFFENWLFDRVEWIDGFPVISLQGLIFMKQQLGREKDLADLAAIKDYIQKHSAR
ncbi:MAG: hypothetical protein IKI69_03395 [Oscillospiraceae bacterium]|nr:hypothetical protein [Oscillospiraceae bacterium]